MEGSGERDVKVILVIGVAYGCDFSRVWWRWGEKKMGSPLRMGLPDGKQKQQKGKEEKKVSAMCCELLRGWESNPRLPEYESGYLAI